MGQESRWQIIPSLLCSVLLLQHRSEGQEGVYWGLKNCFWFSVFFVPGVKTYVGLYKHQKVKSSRDMVLVYTNKLFGTFLTADTLCRGRICFCCISASEGRSFAGSVYLWFYISLLCS